MLDIRKIKENPDAVKAGLKAKEVDCDAVIDRILELDVEIRALKTSSESRTAQKNKLAKENGKLYGMKKGLEKKGESTAEVDAKIAANTCESIKIDEEIASDLEKLNLLNGEYRTAMLSLPRSEERRVGKTMSPCVTSARSTPSTLSPNITWTCAPTWV